MEWMKNLFKDHKLAPGYSTFDNSVIVLPIGLTRYYNMFWNSAGEQLGDHFLQEKHPYNKILETDKWFNPPEEQFQTLLGTQCKAQRNQRWRVFYDEAHPYVPQDVITTICGVTDTSLVIGTVIKRYDVPKAKDYVIFATWEARTHDIRSNQVVLRFSAQQYWYEPNEESDEVHAHFVAEMTHDSNVNYQWHKKKVDDVLATEKF